MALDADAALRGDRPLLKNEEIKNGVFAFSISATMLPGRRCARSPSTALNTKSAPQDWKRSGMRWAKARLIRFRKARRVSVFRFSFYEKSGANCQAKVLVDDVILKKHQPAVKNDWPPR